MCNKTFLVHEFYKLDLVYDREILLKLEYGRL